MNDSTSPIDASDDAMMNKGKTPVAARVTDPKQATVEEQKAALVNSGTSAGVQKEWITRKGSGSMNVPEGKIHVNHDAATDHLSIVSEDEKGNRTSQFDQKLDRSAEGKDRTPPTVSYHPSSKTIKVQTPKTHQWESEADWSGPAKLINAQRIVGKAVEIPLLKIANSASFEPTNGGWLNIAKVGEFPHAAAGVVQVITDDSLKNMCDTFHQTRGDETKLGVMLDRDHISDLSTNTRAAGWVKDMKVENGNLWALPAWTPDGEKDFLNGSYRGLSPVFLRNECVDLGNGRLEPRVINKIGLTNNPNMDLLPTTRLAV
jgi:hypothetical protein